MGIMLEATAQLGGGDVANTLSRQQERQLVLQAQAGNAQAVRKLVDLHKDRLFSFIWRMIRNHHDAEEVCQDAFLKAFSSLDSFSTDYRFSTWLFTIGYRVCLNRMRRRRPVVADLDFASVPCVDDRRSWDVIESEEAGKLRDMVWSTVAQLSVPQRATVLLFYRHDMSCQDIARVLEIPIATVKSHLHRGRLRLRVLLESLSEEDIHRFRNRAG